MTLTVLLFGVAAAAFGSGYVFKRFSLKYKKRDFEAQTAQLEAELNADQFRAIVKASLDGIIIIDADGMILEFSESAEKIFGYDRTKVIGMPMAQLIVPERYRDAHNAGLERMRNSGQENILGKRIEIEATRSNGEEFMSELAVSRSRSSSGEIFISYIRDISEKKSAENKLKAAKDKAEEANEVKSKFLAAMSHEIRTPFNAVLGILELLEDTPINDDQKRLIQTAGNSSKALLRVINDTLDYAKITAGKLNLREEPFSIADVVQETADLFQPVASEKNIELKTNVEVDSGVMLQGDNGRIRQILMNLVSNAIKFTSEGYIELSAKIDVRSDGRADLTCEVKDTGIGIEPAKRRRLFEEFFMVDDGDTRQYSGTGLGLAISRKLVEMMDGAIDVESVVGEGSTFWFTAPLEMAVELPGRSLLIAEDDNIDISGLNILLAEDNKTNQMVVGRMLDKHNCNVTIAENGVEALKHLTVKEFDVVLMDISMPIMGGIKATQIIRDKDNSFASIPIIALTAIASNDDTERFYDVGMDAVLTKPVSRDVLIKQIFETVKGETKMTEENDAKQVQGQSLFAIETLADLFGDITAEDLSAFENQLRIDLVDLIAQLDESIAGDNIELAEKSSHTLKGLAATYGIMALSEQAHLTNSYTLSDSTGDWVNAAKRSIEIGQQALRELDQVFSQYLDQDGRRVEQSDKDNRRTGTHN